MNGSWRDFLASPVYRQFGLEKARYGDECRSCPWLAFCHGDCQKLRPGAGSSKSALCEGWKAFFTHALPRLQGIADGIKKQASHTGSP